MRTSWPPPSALAEQFPYLECDLEILPGHDDQRGYPSVRRREVVIPAAGLVAGLDQGRAFGLYPTGNASERRSAPARPFPGGGQRQYARVCAAGTSPEKPDKLLALRPRSRKTQKRPMMGGAFGSEGWEGGCGRP